MANPMVVKVPKPGSSLISAFDAGCDFELPIDLLTAPARVERRPGQPHAAPKSAEIGTHDSSQATICKAQPGLSGGRGHLGIRHKGTTGSGGLVLEASLRPYALRRDRQASTLTDLPARAFAAPLPLLHPINYHCHGWPHAEERKGWGDHGFETPAGSP
jgi:hypothetical protein